MGIHNWYFWVHRSEKNEGMERNQVTTVNQLENGSVFSAKHVILTVHVEQSAVMPKQKKVDKC